MENASTAQATVDLTQDEYRDKIGKETSNMRLAESTRTKYSSALNRFKCWLSDKHPDCNDEDNEVKLPISSSVMTTFMYHAMLKVDKDGQHLDPLSFTL